MSKEQIRLTWGTAKAQAEEESIYNLPEGNTRIVIDRGFVEKSTNFTGKWIAKALIDGKPIKLSLSGKNLIKLSDESTDTFDIMRIGLTASDTRYLITPVKNKK